MADYYDACPSEPYVNQPVPGDCTGFLVADDVIATAGHCINNNSCRNMSFVFGFRLDGPGDIRDEIPPDDLYTCDQIISRSNTNNLDYAVVKLDRPVVGHQPLEIRRSGQVSMGTPLIIAGHPLGLPLKIPNNATVRSNRANNTFGANADVYEGNSGSPVVNASTLEVEGILVSGNDDWQRTGGCYVTNVCPDSGCPTWEDVTRTTIFASSVPTSTPPTPLNLAGTPFVDAGGRHTWYFVGPPNETVVLVTGSPGSTTQVPGCSATTIPANNIRVLDSVVTDSSGNAEISKTIPLGLAGSNRSFWGVARTSCVVSNVHTLSIL
jgi:hypothetical protein